MTVASIKTLHKFFQLRSLSAVTLFRIAFGIVWLVDGSMKFLWLQPSDVLKLVQNASQGQPAWLHPWYNFWIGSLTSTPAAFLHGIGLIEIALGLALIVGFLRKVVYLGGIILSLMIWSIVEGFGGPYGSGSTDIGAAIMYAFIFVGIIIVARSSNYNKYSLDALIERKLKGWKHLAEFYNEKMSSSKRLNGFHAYKTILKADPMVIKDMILRQKQNSQEQPMYTVEVSFDGSRNPEVGKKDRLTRPVPSIYENGKHYSVDQKINIGTLEIPEIPDIQEIKGEYSGKDAFTTS